MPSTQRIHGEMTDSDAPTVTAARGHRITVGDLIISRRNDPTVTVSTGGAPQPADPVRNGNRWRVYAVDAKRHRIAAHRLDDGAAVVFSGEYLRDHVTDGYAVTVHSAQGVTADAAHAVLSESATRSKLYVAITRGRHANTAYFYERLAGEGEYEQPEPAGRHVLRRGTNRQAGPLARAIIANHDDQVSTAHDIAARTPSAVLPAPIRGLVDRRSGAASRRRAAYRSWQAEARHFAQSMTESRVRQTDRSRALDHGVDL